MLRRKDRSLSPIDDIDDEELERGWAELKSIAEDVVAVLEGELAQGRDSSTTAMIN